jgi:hypothetical protein
MDKRVPSLKTEVEAIYGEKAMQANVIDAF